MGVEYWVLHDDDIEWIIQRTAAIFGHKLTATEISLLLLELQDSRTDGISLMQANAEQEDE